MNITTTKTYENQPKYQSIMHSTNSDFPIAITLLAIIAIVLLLASYYIFVIKCCLNWSHIDPLRRFSISNSIQPDNNNNNLFLVSPRVDIHRGLDEWLINNIPAIQYKSGAHNSNSNSNNNSLRRCAVCLNGFKEKETLRNLPKCGHNFHLDCIDIWLMKNASCPLCRSNISGRTKYPIHQIVAPNSSPLFSGNLSLEVEEIDDDDYLVIDLLEDRDNVVISSSNRQKKVDFRQHYKNISIMGDECVDMRRMEDEFKVHQPIRRSISMDSVVNRGMYLQVQEILRQNSGIVASSSNNNSNSNIVNVRDEINNNSNGRIRRSSFFSFRYGRGSRSSSILPVTRDLR